MRMRAVRAAMGVAVLATACAGASAQAQVPAAGDRPEPPAALVGMVVDEINAFAFDRAHPFEGPPRVETVPAGVIRAVDVSRDGRSDWLVDYSDSGLPACGTGGCLRTLYVSAGGAGGDAWVMAFDAQSATFDLTERDGETRVEIEVHHIYCQMGQDGPCAFGFAWDAAAGRLVERPNAAGETLLVGGGFDPTPRRNFLGDPGDAAPDDVSETLAGAVRAAARFCTAVWDAAPRMHYADLSPTPDLDGDGRRDWVLTPPGPCAGDAAADDAVIARPPFEVWLSGPGAREPAFRSGPGERPGFDIATRPAALISNPSCGLGEPCADVRLFWTGARFERR